MGPSFLSELVFHSKPRLPEILQSERSECALACIAMIAGFHGASDDLSSLRVRAQISQKGTSLASLLKIARLCHLNARAIKVDISHMQSLRLPCILHWDFNHFVVLKKLTTKVAIVHDPAYGKRELSRSALGKSFTGVAVELWPEDGFVRGESPRAAPTLGRLIGSIRGGGHAVTNVFILAVALEMFAVINPLFFQVILDQVVVANSADLLITSAVAFCLAALLQHAIRLARAWALMRLSTNLSVQWKANTFAHLLRLPMAYFERRHLGDVDSRFSSVTRIQETLTGSFLEGVLDGLMSAIVLTILFLYSAVLGTMVVSVTIIVSTITILFHRAQVRATKSRIICAAAQQSHFLETVRGIRTLKIFQGEGRRVQSWMKLLVNEVNAGLLVQKLHLTYRTQRGVILSLGNILVLWVGAKYVIEGRFTAGMLMSFFVYKMVLEQRITEFIDRLGDVRMLKVEIERLADIVTTEPESMEGVLSAPQVAATVTIKGVRFRYGDQEPYVLDGVDLDVREGECVAITGVSGCGKTTLVNIILGLAEPCEGDVQIGGLLGREMGVQGMRACMGAVMQDDVLFAGSIADNISFFEAGADQEWIEECAKTAAIHSEIMAMPMRYASLVGDMGTVLSGGQKQRILIARALYRRPRILLMDEATSHLDIECERVVSEAIRRLNLTRIIIAHRPQTIASAGRCFVMSRGKIAEDSVSRRERLFV